MDQSTCSAPDCERPIQRRQWCNAHYRRLLKSGALKPRMGMCEDCGVEYEGPKAGPLPGQCDPCRTGRTDCIACGTYIGLTPRSSGYGMSPAPLYCSETCKPRCSVSDCEKPVRKRGWCVNHYSTWYNHGDPNAELSVTWATEWRCKTCGNTDRSTWTRDARTFCSDACRVTWKRYGGDVPAAFDCIICGVEVAYFDPTTRRRLRLDAAYCSKCVRAARKYVTAERVAAEDGTDCKLCGLPVDLSVASPSRLAASVDHIVPRALGGGDERENLQLAHRGCNSSKGHRYVG